MKIANKSRILIEFSSNLNEISVPRQMASKIRSVKRASFMRQSKVVRTRYPGNDTEIFS